MPSNVPTIQSDDITAPRRGSTIALTVDSTARPYDLGLITLGGKAFLSGKSDKVYVTLLAAVDMFVHFHSATASDLSDTAAISAGGTFAYANTYGILLPAKTPMSFRLDRTLDRWMIVKVASTGGILNLWASSPAYPGAQ